MSRKPSWLVPLALVAALMAAPLVMLLPGAEAESIGWTGHRLHNLVAFGAAAATDEAIYLLGGHDSFAGRALDDIVRYDPRTGAVEEMGARMPSPLYYPTATSDGESVYVLGGVGRDPEGSRRISGAIHRYDPANDTLTTLDVQLPVPVYAASAVWAQGAIYVFGGSGCPASYHAAALYRCAIIQRVDPGTGVAEVLPQRVPREFSFGNAVLVGDSVYLLGGLSSSYNPYIWRFDIDTGRIRTMDAQFEYGRYGAMAFTDGRYIWHFGGRPDRDLVESIADSAVPDSREHKVFRYDTQTDTLVRTDAWLWDAREHGHALWFDGRGIVIGGRCDRLADCLEVVSYKLTPGAPREIRSVPTPEGNLLTWTPPRAESTTTPIEAYRVYLVDGYERHLLGEVTDGTSFVHAGCDTVVVCQYSVSAVNAAGEGPDSWSTVMWGFVLRNLP